MKALLAAALITLASPAFAADRVWVDEWCVSSLTSSPTKKGFQFSNTDGTGEMSCTIEDWPIRSSMAILRCNTGAAATLEFTEDGSAVFNGKLMHLAGDKRVLCD